MSAFIVISLNDKLNWIVDGIKECLPHNPKAITYLSTGKIKKEQVDKYLYEYSVYSKHVGENYSDNTLASNIESDIPRNLFSNQIAQFLNACENEGGQINIFLLDNPITDDDFEHSSWLIDEIRAVYERRIATNFQIVRILFTYQIDKPTDVNTQVSQMTLKQLTKMSLDKSDDFLSRILYIDNQNRNGAALCLNKKEHDIMIPRMLCDLMMLLSSRNDSYNVSTAINGETNMFSVGYAECMYYHDDIFHYYYIVGERDLIQYLLKATNTEDSLDYKKYPIGLEERLDQLEAKYKEVPFYKDISLFDSSIDKAIDDILHLFKNDIIELREEALKNAQKEDSERTKAKQISYLKSSGKLSQELSEEYLEANYESIAKDLEIDLNKILVTEAFDKANKEYPEYIDRQIIFDEYLIEETENEDVIDTFLDNYIGAYNNLIKFIQSKSFKEYVRKQCNIPSVKHEEEFIPMQQSKKVCWLKKYSVFLKQIFSSKNTINKNVNKTQIEANTPKRDWHSLHQYLSSIVKMHNERTEYNSLKEYISMMQTKLDELNSAISKFRLTKHCSSIDNLIDLKKLEEYHKKGKDIRLKKVFDKWNSRNDNEKSYETLLEDFKETTKWELFNFYYINWNEPFEFLKDIDFAYVCENLKKRSLPFVNTYTLCPNAENLTSYNFYSDNEIWNEKINNGEIHLQDNNKITGTKSNHICSKICMFQFLQMNRELIDGLVDCYTNDSI